MTTSDGSAAGSWNDAPEDVVIQILKRLDLRDVVATSGTCSTWYRVCSMPMFWHKLDFIFNGGYMLDYFKLLAQHGAHLKTANFFLDQGDARNREKAGAVLLQIAAATEIQLDHLKIEFTGENPCFYSGKDLIEPLFELLKAKGSDVGEGCTSLKSLDLNGFPVMLDHIVLDLLRKGHKHIEVLNLQNSIHICKISPPSLLELVQTCHSLRELHIHSCSLVEDTLQAFTEKGPSPIALLSLFYNRADKFKVEMSSEIWAKVRAQLPKLRLKLHFDSSCPLDRIEIILKPEMPVREIRMETAVFIHKQVFETVLGYSETLEKCVLYTPISRDLPLLNKLILQLAQKCHLLGSLHVFCILEEDTVNQVLTLHPQMVNRGSFTLRYTEDICPWIPRNDC